ncbi:MAG: hypothetical protein ACI8ZM_002472 [Crocinitomix sp.]|jgi:hypothetical protein
MDQNQKIQKFVGQISQGYALKLVGEKAGMPIPIIDKFTPIERLTMNESLFEYISKVVSTFSPDLLIATTKDQNGNSLYKPRTYHMSVQQEPSFGGLGSTSDPMGAFYQAKNADLTRQLTRLENTHDTLLTKHDELKEKFSDNKRLLDTVNERNELTREKDRVASENTFSGIVKELKPEIQGLIGVITSKHNPPAQNEGQLNGINSESKFAIIIAMLNGLGDADFKRYWEVIVRFGQTEQAQSDQVLELLRSLTVDFNDSYNQYNSKPNK